MPKTTNSQAILASIRSVIRLEAETLNAVARSTNISFVRGIRLLKSCRGKIVVTGIGKSGIIAQKIASTLASTGTPALYMHPAEGLHGDLGLVERKDLILAIGKSGESAELTGMLPTLKRIGVKIVAITGNAKSTLARNADVVLKTPIKKEACPLDLAPTTSTTAALAVGDAIAVTLMRMRNFRRDQFARLHPGGSLGKRLTLRVSDVMRGGKENPTVSINASLSKVLDEMTLKHAGAVCVVDSKKKLVGLITDFDIRKVLNNKQDPRKLTARQLMNAKPARIGNRKMAVDAVEIMDDRENPFNVLPVIDAGGRAVGIVQVHDLRAIGL